MRCLKTKGIILKKRNFQENDHILTIYTPEFGKLEVIAKGSRKITSRFAGHFELLNLNKFEIYRGSKNTILTNCNLLQSFHHNGNPLNNLTVLSQLAELIDKTTAWQHPVPEIYVLSIETLKKLNQFPEKKELIKIGFIIKILDILGYLPNFQKCQNCHEKFDGEKTHVYFEDFRLTCNRCNKNEKDKNIFDLKIFKCINYIQINKLDKLIQIKASESEIDRVNYLLAQILRMQINCEIKSLNFT